MHVARSPVSESVHPLEVLFEEEEEKTGVGAATAVSQLGKVTPSLGCGGRSEEEMCGGYRRDSHNWAISSSSSSSPVGTVPVPPSACKWRSHDSHMTDSSPPTSLKDWRMLDPETEMVMSMLWTTNSGSSTVE